MRHHSLAYYQIEHIVRHQLTGDSVGTSEGVIVGLRVCGDGMLGETSRHRRLRNQTSCCLTSTQFILFENSQVKGLE
jgi:hypothetical protein